jgi:lysophospholipase L1-like esterase
MKKQLTYLFAFLSILASLCHGEQPVLRIMPLGDSITQGCCSGFQAFGGYRSKLYDLLTLGGVAVDFVGTLSDPPNNGSLPDRDHQGYPGATIEMLQNSMGNVFTNVLTPDIILLDIGTNNFWNGDQPIAVSMALKALIEQVAMQSPSSKILVSNLLLRTDDHAVAQDQFRRDYLPALVSDEVARGRHVSIADLHSALLGSDLTADRVHPTVNGYNKMAVAWYQAIKEATGSILNDPVNMLSNGGFESNAFGPSGDLTYGPYAVEGWVTFGSPSGWTTEWNPVLSTTEGSKVVFFNAGDNSYDGYISQTFSTVPGTIYQLSFDAGIVVSESWAPRQQSMGVTVSGSSELLSTEVKLRGNDGRAQWHPHQVYFTADSSNTSVVFLDRSRELVAPTAQYSDLLLDNVRLIVSPKDPTLVARSQAITVKTGEEFKLKLTGWLDQITQPENIRILTVPSHGSLTSTGDDITYSSEPGYIGPDFFSFTVTNGSTQSSPGIITITVVPSEAATLTNGSFESGSLVGGFAGGYNLDGWQVSGTPFGLGTSWNSRLSATDGERIVFFNPGSDAFGGSISQTFATIPGVAYILTFDTGIVVSETWAPRQQELLVEVSGNGLISSNSVLMIGQEGAAVWASEEIEFVADGTSTTLCFSERSGSLFAPTANLSDLLLDNVKVLPKTVIQTYNEWLALNSLSQSGLGDNDGDNISDIIEFVIGGDPTTGHDQMCLPVGRIVISDPDGTAGLAPYLLFQYKRSEASAADPTIDIKVEYGTELNGQWLDASANPIVKSVLSSDALQDRTKLVSCYIPLVLGVNGKLFARLSVRRL